MEPIIAPVDKELLKAELTETDGDGLGITVLLAQDLQIHHIPRHHKRHKNYQIIHSSESFSLGCNVCNQDIL